MINVIRKNEILEEIRKIEMGREEAELYIKKRLLEENDWYEELRIILGKIRNDYEICYGDVELTNLTEEYHSMLMSAERECSGTIDDIHEAQRKMNAKCESDIEELKQEMQRLEMM